MPNRATAKDVENIIDFDPSISDLNPFIDMANELVNQVCQNPPTPPPGAVTIVYSERRLKQIETWLAAHFLAIRDPRYVSESIGRASATYQQSVGPNLALTPYGQQAQMMDTNGGLAFFDKHISQGKRAVVGIVHLGTDPRCSRWYGYPWRFYDAFLGG